jgi:peptidoglycan hydrolase-like protein with peptidoglycan-binding domain/tellurite resistance protein
VGVFSRAFWTAWKCEIKLGPRACRAAVCSAFFVLLVFGSTPALSQDAQDDLRRVQQALQALGYEVGPIDGIMGPRTSTAIEEYQRKSGLPVTGTADAGTIRLLTTPPPPPTSIPTPPAASQNKYPRAAPDPQPPPAAQSKTDPSTSPKSAPSPSSKSNGTFWFIVLALGFAGVALWRRRARQSEQIGSPVSSSNAQQGISTPSSTSASLTSPIGVQIVVSPDNDRRYYGQSWGSPPSPQTLAEQSRQCWKGADQTLAVAGHELRGGLLYVGRELLRQDGGGVENCLIDPTLRAVDPGVQPYNLPYYPRYSALEPQARGAYLAWLASGRNAPDANIGLVFLYFYGLERRLMLDQSADEAPVVLAEVRRLRSAYHKNYSVERYSQLLLDAAQVVYPPRAFYDEPPPEARRDYELPLSIRMAIGQLISEGKTVSWNWMYAWVINDPETNLRTVHTRAGKEVKELFRIRFAAKYPDGFKINPPKARITCTYRAASGSFIVDLKSKVGELPDIVRLTGPTNKMRELLDGCTRELEGYSRFLGRRPDGRDSVQAISLLPAELARQSDNAEAKALRDWLDQELANGPALVEAGALMSKCAVEGTYGKPTIRICAETLAAFNVAMIPNPRLSLQLPKIGQPFVLYRSEEAEIPDSEIAAFRYATLTLTFAAFVAYADSSVSEEETRRLSGLVDGARGLSPRGRAALRAHLRWLQAVPAEPGVLRSRLAGLSPDDRRQLGFAALGVACSDASVHPPEIKALQRIYRVLGLDEAAVLTDLHAALAAPVAAVPAGLTLIQIGDGATEGHKIPAKPSAPATGEIRLDPERLKQIGESTQRVNEILSKVFVDEEVQREKAAPAEEEVTAPAGAFEGLDLRYKSFLAELLTRPQWQREDLDLLARGHDLMTAGALEAINEWAFDRYGDAIAEDGEPVVIQRQLVETAMATAND